MIPVLISFLLILVFVISVVAEHYNKDHYSSAKHRHPENVRRRRGDKVKVVDDLESTLDSYIATLTRKS